MSSTDDLLVRVRRFNRSTGVYGYVTASGPLGGNHHPDRCVCQGDPNLESVDLRRGAVGPRGDTTPHKHHEQPPYRCARCTECNAYEPRLPDTHVHAWKLHKSGKGYTCWCGEAETYAEHHRGFGTNVAPRRLVRSPA